MRPQGNERLRLVMITGLLAVAVATVLCGWYLCRARNGADNTLDGNQPGVYFWKGRFLGQ